LDHIKGAKLIILLVLYVQIYRYISDEAMFYLVFVGYWLCHDGLVWAR